MGTTRRDMPAPARPEKLSTGSRHRAILLLTVGMLGLLAAFYFAARETSVFAVRTIGIQGAPPDVAESVRAALEPVVGESLVALDASAVEDRLEAIPSVQAAAVDRDFPTTLNVHIRPARAIAVVRQAEAAWLVAATGRIIRQVNPGASSELPRVWLSPQLDPPRPGATLVADEGGAAVAALAAVPGEFPVTVRTARGTPDDLVLRLGFGTELRLGPAADLRLKLRVAATVLASLSRSQREALSYLDVSMPTRPVGGEKSQVIA
jgi:cell division protein FtsQ